MRTASRSSGRCAAFPRARTKHCAATASTRVQVPGKRGSFRQEFDNVLYLAKLAAACTVYPNLNDAELQDSYGTKCAEELISAMLTPGEYTNYTEKLFDICGFGDKLDLVEQAKN